MSFKHILDCIDLHKVEHLVVVLVALIGAVTTFLTIKDPHKLCILRTIYSVLGIGALITSQIWLVLYGAIFPFGIIGAISAVLGLHALVLPELRIQISALKKLRCKLFKPKKHHKHGKKN